MEVHILFDLLSYLFAFVVAKYLGSPSKGILPQGDKGMLYLAGIVGFVSGSVGLGSLNIWLSQDSHMILGKSILGALFGGIVAIEGFKKSRGIKGSTGAYFTPSLAIGISVGRIGCFLAGLEDYTYGIETTLPWGVDFGDRIIRHPVQLYESLAMFAFFLYALWRYRVDKVRFEQKIFYQFILWYATQRFVWELLKPYESIALGINLFGWVCLVLVGYALMYLRKKKGEQYGILCKKL